MATTAEPSTTSELINKPTVAKGWGTDAPDQPLRPMEVERRALRPDDVAIRITYAGICHSDLHQCQNDWAGTIYPIVPGHEIVGVVTAIGNEVTRHRVGTISKGGYTDHIIVRDHFVLKVPDGMDVSRVAPLLCAGITTYSPLRQYDVGPGKKMAVVGLGGLGHMGVKLGAALGAHVTMITTTPSKGQDARELGAHDVIISTDAEQMQAAATRFDFILNTIPVSHEIDGYLQLLGRSGRMVIVGAL